MPNDHPEVFSIVSCRLDSGEYLYGNGRMQRLDYPKELFGATGHPQYRGTFEMRGSEVPRDVDFTGEILIGGYHIKLRGIVKESELARNPLRLTLTLESTEAREL